MKRSSKAEDYQKNLRKLQQLVSRVAPDHEERIMNGTVMYFYKSQTFIAYKRKGHSLLVLTPGKTPKARRKAMRSYMTLLGNIKIRPGQTFPAAQINNILVERKDLTDTNPGKPSIYLRLSSMSKNGTPLRRHEKTALRIKKAEQQFPGLQKITRHKKFGPWILPVATAIEIAAGLFALLVLLPWVLSFLPDIAIPLPRFNLPDIPLPKINLPQWQIPFTLPDLPAWVDTALYWFNKTLPIWIALFIAIRSIRKKDANKTK